MNEPSVMDESSLRDVYSRLIQINRETFDGGQYDVAYHALSGALQCAVSLKEVNYLSEVERLADQQLKWIDAHDPKYEHSTQSSSERGLTSIFRNLVNMANTRTLIIQHRLTDSPLDK
jgi:hypothetical protein